MRVIQVAAVLALALAALSALSRYGKSTEPIAECPCAGCCRGVPTVRTPTAYAPGQATAADDSSDSAPQSPQEKPETESAKPPETATELDDILAHWESATSKIRRLHCEFSRFRYDRTFEIEKRGEGSISLDRDGLAQYKVGGAPLPPPGVGARKANANGVPFDVQSEDAAAWIWTGPRLYLTDDKEKTYQVFEVPANRRVPSLGELDVWYMFWAKPFLLPTDKLELTRNLPRNLPNDADELRRLRSGRRLNPRARAIRPSERGSGGTRGLPRLLIPARL